jgi:hypothetical protein
MYYLSILLTVWLIQLKSIYVYDDSKFDSLPEHEGKQYPKRRMHLLMLLLIMYTVKYNENIHIIMLKKSYKPKK